jgi:hypothetical protein
VNFSGGEASKRVHWRWNLHIRGVGGTNMHLASVPDLSHPCPGNGTLLALSQCRCCPSSYSERGLSPSLIGSPAESMTAVGGWEKNKMGDPDERPLLLKNTLRLNH